MDLPCKAARGIEQYLYQRYLGVTWATLVCTDCWVADGQWFKQLAELSRQPYFYLKFATLIFLWSFACTQQCSPVEMIETWHCWVKLFCSPYSRRLSAESLASKIQLVMCQWWHSGQQFEPVGSLPGCARHTKSRVRSTGSSSTNWLLSRVNEPAYSSSLP